MFTGYSALAMAEALPDDGVVVACETRRGRRAVRAASASTTSPAGRRITVEVGPAMDTLQRAGRPISVPPFDLVFIDADKAGLSRLPRVPARQPAAGARRGHRRRQHPAAGSAVREQRRARRANGAAIASFNAAVAADPRVEQVLLPLRDGLTLIRRADVRRTIGDARQRGRTHDVRPLAGLALTAPVDLLAVAGLALPRRVDRGSRPEPGRRRPFWSAAAR